MVDVLSLCLNKDVHYSLLNKNNVFKFISGLLYLSNG